MQILVAVDPYPYTENAVRVVAGLAANTWANVTLLGLGLKKSHKDMSATGVRLDNPVFTALRRCREQFLDFFKDDFCPYTQREFGYELVEISKGVWEELYVAKSAKKDLRTRIRIGNPVKAVLAEAEAENSDLIVMGCDSAHDCSWTDSPGLPQRVVNEAQCSVLVAKQGKTVERIVCCLDQERVTQPSLELINQLVTIHKAKLTIAGFTGEKGLRAEVEKSLGAIHRYYTGLKIEPFIEVVDAGSLDAFIEKEARGGLLALWMGRQSILGKLLPKSKVNRLVKGSRSSVLVLR